MHRGQEVPIAPPGRSPDAAGGFCGAFVVVFFKSCVGSGSVNIFRVPLKLPFNRSSPPYFLVLSVDVVQRKVSERVAELQCLGAPPHSALRCRPLLGEPALNSIFLAVGHI